MRKYFLCATEGKSRRRLPSGNGPGWGASSAAIEACFRKPPLRCPQKTEEITIDGRVMCTSLVVHYRGCKFSAVCAMRVAMNDLTDQRTGADAHPSEKLRAAKFQKKPQEPE